MNGEYFAATVVLLAGLISHNTTIVYAVGFVLILKLLHFDAALSLLGTEGLNFGVIILTAAILVRLVDGTIDLKILFGTFASPLGIITLLMGIVTAASAGKGIIMLKSNPEIISALVIGTMAGVFFFKGVAVGPLIAAGFAHFIASVIGR